MLKKILVLLAIIIFVPLAILWSISAGTYGEFLKGKIVSLAKENHINLALGASELNLTHFSTSTLELQIPQTPLLALLQQVELQYPLLALLRGEFKPDLKAKIYGGEILIKAEIDRNIIYPTNKDSKLKASVDLNSLQLQQHPQISALGVEKGKLDLKLKIDKAQTQFQADGDIALNELSFPTQKLLENVGLKIPFKLDLPEYSEINIEGPFRLTDQAIELQSVKFHTNYGEGTVQGNVKLSQSKANMNLAINVSLSDQGMRSFAAYLPIVSAGKLSEASRKFQLKVTGNNRSPIFKYSP